MNNETRLQNSDQVKGNGISMCPTEFRLEGYLPYRLSLLSNTVSQGIAQRYQRDHDVSVTEWRVIVVLGRFPGSTASEVVERTAMDKVAISRAVHSLIEKGLLQRQTDQSDRRRMRLFLTRVRGRKLLESVVPLAAAYETELLGAITASERHELHALLDKLQRSAETLRDRLFGPDLGADVEQFGEKR